MSLLTTPWCTLVCFHTELRAGTYAGGGGGGEGLKLDSNTPLYYGSMEKNSNVSIAIGPLPFYASDP